jgi:hypothetical protein
MFLDNLTNNGKYFFLRSLHGFCARTFLTNLSCEVLLVYLIKVLGEFVLHLILDLLQVNLLMFGDKALNLNLVFLVLSLFAL